MSKQNDAAHVGRFRSAEAQAAWLAAYDDTLASWPVRGKPVDVPTRYGPTRAYRYGAGGFAKVGWRHYRWALATGLAILGPRAWHGRIGRRLHTPSLARVDDIRVGLRAMSAYRPKLPPVKGVFTDDELAAITVPTLLMLAGHSTLHRSAEVAERAAAHLPQARIDLVPGVGHSLPFDAPDAVNSATLTFLATSTSTRHEQPTPTTTPNPMPS